MTVLFVQSIDAQPYLPPASTVHRLDLVVNNEVVVELKAVQSISDVHLTQVISYLKASGLKVGLILNFSKGKIDIKRVVFD